MCVKTFKEITFFSQNFVLKWWKGFYYNYLYNFVIYKHTTNNLITIWETNFKDEKKIFFVDGPLAMKNIYNSIIGFQDSDIFYMQSFD